MTVIQNKSAVSLLYGQKDCLRKRKWKADQVIAAQRALELGTLSLIDAIDFFLSLPRHNAQSFDLALKINKSLLDEGRGGLSREHLKKARSPNGQSKYLIDADCYYLPRK